MGDISISTSHITVGVDLIQDEVCKIYKYGALRLDSVWLALKVSFLNSVEYHTAVGWYSKYRGIR